MKKIVRLYGKIERNENFEWDNFLIDSLLWGGGLAVLGYYLPQLSIRDEFICVHINIITGAIAGISYSYFDSKWDFPYFSGSMVLLAHVAIFLFICLYFPC